MNRLVVIYEKGSGKILRCVSGGGITRRSDLERYLPGWRGGKLGFYYEELSAGVDMERDVIRVPVHGRPPVLCDENGRAKVFPVRIIARRKELAWVKGLKIDFEGGMGDQVLQLEAVKELRAARPDLDVRIGVRDSYWRIFPYLEKSGAVCEKSGPVGEKIGQGYVSMATEYISDPRGGLYGKASLYGASLGLERVKQHVDFSMPVEAREYWVGAGGVDIRMVKKPLLVIHIRSGSGGAKSWNCEHAQHLAVKWHGETGGDVYLCGARSDYSLEGGFVWFLKDGADWASVGAMVLSADLVVGIDSGPMHLARSGGVPLIILWGGTGPGDILGRGASSIDIRASLPCIDNICYSCPLGTSLCMRAIRVEQVWGAIIGNYGDLVRKRGVVASGEVVSRASGGILEVGGLAG